MREDETRLRGLLAKATPGPWQVGGVRQKLWPSPGGRHAMQGHAVGPDGLNVATFWMDPESNAGLVDAHLAALAVTLLPELLGELDRLRTEREQ